VTDEAVNAFATSVVAWTLRSEMMNVSTLSKAQGFLNGEGGAKARGYSVKERMMEEKRLIVCVQRSRFQV
jgi:hypothetical protein